MNDAVCRDRLCCLLTALDSAKVTGKGARLRRIALSRSDNCGFAVAGGRSTVRRLADVC